MKEQQLVEELERFSKQATLDARGVRITNQLLARIQDATPRDTNGHRHPWRPKFDRAIFSDDVSFESNIFDDNASFAGAEFGDNASFAKATFGEHAHFSDAVFGHRASFEKATFGDTALFSGLTFGRGASFSGVTFGDHALIDAISFEGVAFFDGLTFGNGSFGPLLVTGELRLPGATFGRAHHFDIYCRYLSLHNARFPNGVTLRMAWADVWFPGVELGGPSILAVAPSQLLLPKVGWLRGDEIGQRVFSDADGDDMWKYKEAHEPWRTARPRLMSIAGTDTSQLTLAGVDLRACRFTDAYRLDQITVEGRFPFADRPRGIKWGLWPPIWSWTRRRTLAEEHLWRATWEHSTRRQGWCSDESGVDCGLEPKRPVGSPSVVRHERRVGAREVSQLYHALRRAQEDRKDEPGAADFYYGEMEMRRRSLRIGFERALLFLYWLVSGYALRASRALVALLGVISIAALIFAGPGLRSTGPRCSVVAENAGAPVYRCEAEDATSYRERLPDSFIYSAESSTSLLRGPDQPLERLGQWTQTLLRLVGPVLYGLAIVSLRGRVKR